MSDDLANNGCNKQDDIHWKWRLEMAETIARELDPERFGIKAFYLIGSAKNAESGPASDIDILLHIDSTESQRKLLLKWFDEWSCRLSEVNRQITGFYTEGLLDVHLVTDEEVEKKSGHAFRIDAVDDGALRLPMKDE